MKTTYLSFLALLAAATASAQEPLQPGTYYIQNAATGTYISSGATWGTRAVLSPHGVDFKVTVNNGKYTLTTGIQGKDKALRPSDGYMDQSGEWTVTPVADGCYTMFNGSNYFGYVATNAHPWVPRLDATADEGDATHWRFLSKDYLLATMATATKENPVDATFLIQAPDMLIGDSRITTDKVWGSDLTATSGLTGSANYVRNNSNAERWNVASYDVYQELKGLPAGTYSLSVQGFYRYGSTSTAANARNAGTEKLLPKLYAGSLSVPVMSIFEHAKTEKDDVNSHESALGYVVDTQGNAAIAFDRGEYVNTIDNIVVADGTLRIGIRKTSQTVGDDWMCFDNFTLTYYGLDMAVMRDAALDMVKTYEGKNTRKDELYAAELEALRTRAASLSTEAELTAFIADIKAAYSRYASRPEPTTKALALSSLLTNNTLADGLMGWNEQHTNMNDATRGFSVDATLNPTVVEIYAGVSSQEIADFSLKQDVALAPGMYRVKTNAFFRYGTSYNSDLNNTGGPITQAYLVAGGHKQPIMRLGDVEQETYPNSMSEAATVFGRGSYANSLCFTLDEAATVTLGVEGAFDRDRSWFIFTPIVLEKINQDILDAEAATAFDALKKYYINSWKQYDVIVKQASDPTSYQTALAQITEEMNAARSEAEMGAANAKVKRALFALIQSVPATKGQYDITSFLVNPTFNTDAQGWTAQHTIGQLGTGAAEMYGQADNELAQTLTSMPAGSYTLKVQAFHRPTTAGTSAREYEDGDRATNAVLFLNDVTVPVKNINADGRIFSARVGSDTFGANGRAVPNTVSGSLDAFANGDYWNVLRADVAQEGDLTLGLRIVGGRSNNWMPFDNFRLYYGAKTLDVNLQSNVKFNIAEDCYANVTTDVTLKAGQWNGICVPFDMPASEFKEIYTLAGFDYDAEAATAKAIVVPAREVKAGLPYFVKVETDKVLKADDVLLHVATPDTLPVIWDHATVTGAYGRNQARKAWVLNEDGVLEYKASRSSNVGMQPIVFSDMPAAVKLVPLEVVDFGNVNLTVNIENTQARAFLAKAKYSSAASASVIDNYMVPAPVHRDHPNTFIAPLPLNDESYTVTYSEAPDFSDAVTFTTKAGALTAEIMNMYPARTYYYKVEGAKGVVTRGQFTTEGTLRMIKTRSGSNIRDLGGWLTAEGNRLNYGRIYRGGEMNADHVMIQEDRDELRRVGISCEIDLRCDSQIPIVSERQESALGADIPYIYANQEKFGDDALKDDVDKYRANFNFAIKHLREGRSLYFHCIWGADRTGAQAMLFEGLCGVTLDQMYKDYELTSFSIAGRRDKPGLDSKITYLRTLAGSTLQDKFFTYLNTIVGIERQDLIDLIAIMGGDLSNYTDGVENVGAGSVPVAYYTLDGLRHSTPQPGLNIVRKADGTACKIMIK